MIRGFSRRASREHRPGSWLTRAAAANLDCVRPSASSAPLRGLHRLDAWRRSWRRLVTVLVFLPAPPRRSSPASPPHARVRALPLRGALAVRASSTDPAAPSDDLVRNLLSPPSRAEGAVVRADPRPARAAASPIGLISAKSPRGCATLCSWWCCPRNVFIRRPLAVPHRCRSRAGVGPAPVAC